MSELFGFLLFGIIIISINVIVVNFANKNHNKIIIKKKLYEDGLITKKVLEEKQKEILK